MAPVQQKFTVIPELPTGRSNGTDTPIGPPSKPPMTSKQAKKLYKAANKGPKLSKAEQRRQDLFEQDRIRKEFEKEKNQARAKASRDKRKEKEEKEKAAKRKKGLPLVDVHPSQDTLARFIRPQPKPPKEEPAPPLAAQQDDDSDFTLPAESDAEPPSKRRKTTSLNPEREAQDAQEPSCASSSRSAKRQLARSPTPRLSPESKVERPSKRLKSGSPPRKEEARRSQDQSLARFSGSAKQQRSSSPAPQKQVERRLGPPTRTSSSAPKRPEPQVALPPQPTSLGHGQVDEPTDYDADDAEILDLLAQQIANDSFSAEDFLLTDDPVMQSKSKAPVSGPITPRLAESPRHGHIRSNSTSERTEPDGPNADFQTRTMPRQALRGQASGVVDISDQNQTPTKKSIGEEALTRTGTGTCPNTASKTGFRDDPVPKPLDAHPNPARSAEKLAHAAADPSKSTRSPPRASASSKPISRSSLRDISSHEAPQMRSGNDKGSAVKGPLDHSKAVSKMAPPVFRKPELPRSASKTSRDPRTPNMGPPTGPPRFKTPVYQTSGLSGNIPKFLPKAPPPPENRAAAAKSPGNRSHTIHTPAPSSTQLFLSGLEDFFPSPSQERKEIFDDPSCTHREALGNKKTQPAPPRPMLPPKTNIRRTSPTTSHKPGRKPPQRNSLCIARSPVAPALPTCAPTAPKIPANQSKQEDWFPPFSTQDFFFSSQDLREVEEDTYSPGKSQLAPNEAGAKPVMTTSFSLENSTSELPALPAGDKQALARGSGTRPNFHKPEPVAVVASDLHNTQDPWLNLSSQQSKSSLPNTPTAVPSGAKATSSSSVFEPRATQQPGHVAPEGDQSPPDGHIDGNASSAEGMGTNGSSALKQPSLSSSRPVSPQKSPESPSSSPKPFFTSSGTKEMILLAIERSKRTLGEDEFLRRGRRQVEIERQRFAEFRRERIEAKREEELRLAKEEEARIAEEEAWLAREEEARLAQEEAARRAKEEEEAWLAREEEARLAKEEAARLAKEEAARLAKEEAARLAKEEAARLEKEEEARLAREEAGRLVLLERQDQRDIVVMPPPQGRPKEDGQQGPELEDDEMNQLLMESVLDGGLTPGGPAQTKISPPELEDDELDQWLLESVLDGGLTPAGPAQKKTSPRSIFSTKKPAGNAGGNRNRSEGSFEKMVALAHKKVSRRGQEQAPRHAAPAESATKHQAPVTASQETDYGGAEWDECDLDDFL